MVPTDLSVEEKARILAWKYENVSTKEIVKRTGRGESTIRRLVASARGLPLNVVPPRKSASWRPRKSSSITDTLLRREILKNPKTTAGEVKKIHPQLLHNVSEQPIQHRFQKELGLPTFRPFCHKAKKVTKWQSDRDIQELDLPGNSADLNPIENCWNYMKDCLASVDTSSGSRLIYEIK